MSLKQTLSLYLYASATRLLRPFVSRFLKERVKKGKEDAARIDERKGIASKARPKGKMLWLHAASIGEFMSLMPLIQRLNAQNLNVLVTTGTLTSASIAAQRLPNNALHQFVPLDIPAYMERFFDHWQPDLVLLTESEIWPNLISCAVKKAIPIGIVNGRLSERSFLRWKNAPSFIGTLLSKMEFCLTQTREDETRFTALGAKQVQHTGNLKFDCKPLPFDEDALESFLDVSRGRKLWLAASTHEGEEALIVEAHHQIKQKYPDILTVIVPRHPERGTTLADIMRLNGLDVRLRSKSEMPVADTDIYIADTIGELGLFYRASKAALIGCSLVAPGGGDRKSVV